MLDNLAHLFSPDGFMPHGMCYLWRPDILALHVISDALITLAYFSIPFTLLYFVRKRRDLQFNWMFVCFAVFIVACGTTHLLEIVTIWDPVYWLSGTVKAITAIASVPTAILLVRLIPDALRLPSPAALRREIDERERAEREVRRANEALEANVVERTGQLEAANAKLRAQLAHLSLLDRTSRAIGERQDLRSIFQVVLHSVEEHLQIDLACICMAPPESPAITVNAIGPKSFTLAAELGLREQTRIEVDQNGLGRCLRGELVHEPDIAGSRFPFPALLASGGLRALVIAPLIVESKVFGVMICARHAAHSYTSGDCEFLRQLTQHVALAAHQAQLYDSLQKAYEDLRLTQQAILQQERLRALGQMASGIAHDINNALTPAALYAQSLLERETDLSGKSRDSLQIICRAIEDVGHTVARMREFYRPRESQLKQEALEANRIVQQVVELTRVRWSDMPQERGVVITLQTELEENPARIMGSDNEIRDAVTNLVLNAVDAMADGGKLTLRTFHDAATARVGIEVRDTGCGMSEKVRTRCLEPFFTTKGERGTGLGLAMVYGMVQRHNAELRIDSEIGSGTAVTLFFQAAQSGTVSRLVAASRPAQPLHLLVIDDDPLLLTSVRDILEADGHEVVTAAGGQAGIDTFAASLKGGKAFDIVITDLGMPHVDGRTVAAAVKSMSARTPVVLLTGWGHRMLADRENPEHVDRVVSKPPKLAELRGALAELG